MDLSYLEITLSNVLFIFFMNFLKYDIQVFTFCDKVYFETC